MPSFLCRFNLLFFDNKGAVAGVFSVVGLVVIVIAIALITNAVRRRRAKKFDRDVAAAAAEAAANARSPDFGVDDDYGYGGSGGVSDAAGNRSMYGYSDASSHGTYAQQPMGHGAESYGMSEMHGFDPYSTSAAAAGAAGIGAAGLNRSKSNTQPYNAFAGPQTDPYYDNPPVPGQNMRYRQGGSANTQDLLDAAGLVPGVGAGAGLVSRGQSVSTTAHSQSQYSQSSYQPQQSYGAYVPEGYQQTSSRSPPPQQQQTAPAPQPPSRPGSMVDVDPYDGIEESTPNTQANSPGIPNPFAGPIAHSQEGGHGQDDSDDERDMRFPEPSYGPGDSRASLRDEEDYAYGGGRRVLKVANE
ncbi:hypothetical protein BXZ70DRAFT_460165 [Cristinia sonorae]|uniref:Uncharacterized protein n=1 Tax=Cristinia sonorae TaxID=1940300 RepID=A0A8K0UJ54_9AGAR|nr:hypothetical protein BXZ70DRAFT_460165 [Cristinia sonorae]